MDLLKQLKLWSACREQILEVMSLYGGEGYEAADIHALGQMALSSLEAGEAKMCGMCGAKSVLTAEELEEEGFWGRACARLSNQVAHAKEHAKVMQNHLSTKTKEKLEALDACFKERARAEAAEARVADLSAQLIAAAEERGGLMGARDVAEARVRELEADRDTILAESIEAHDANTVLRSERADGEFRGCFGGRMAKSTPAPDGLRERLGVVACFLSMYPESEIDEAAIQVALSYLPKAEKSALAAHKEVGRG